jgi:hypothetical protein
MLEAGRGVLLRRISQTRGTRWESIPLAGAADVGTVVVFVGGEPITHQVRQELGSGVRAGRAGAPR